jgi:hypothetical protein
LVLGERCPVVPVEYADHDSSASKTLVKLWDVNWDSWSELNISGFPVPSALCRASTASIVMETAHVTTYRLNSQ